MFHIKASFPKHPKQRIRCCRVCIEEEKEIAFALLVAYFQAKQAEAMSNAVPVALSLSV